MSCLDCNVECHTHFLWKGKMVILYGLTLSTSLSTQEMHVRSINGYGVSSPCLVPIETKWRIISERKWTDSQTSVEIILCYIKYYVLCNLKFIRRNSYLVRMNPLMFLYPRPLMINCKPTSDVGKPMIFCFFFAMLRFRFTNMESATVSPFRVLFSFPILNSSSSLQDTLIKTAFSYKIIKAGNADNYKSWILGIVVNFLSNIVAKIRSFVMHK